MSEQAPQERPVTGGELINDLEGKGADVGSYVDFSGHDERHVIGTTRQPAESTLGDSVDSTLQQLYDNGRPLGAGTALTSQKKDGIFIQYDGHIAPKAEKYASPRVERVYTDPDTGKQVEYTHTFKDNGKAGQLIAKLAAKRIERTLPPQEDSKEQKAA